MDQTEQRAQQFRKLWATALAQYNRETRLNIEDPAIPHPRNVDELISSLKLQHAEFGEDTRSNAFTNIIKGAIGPFNFLSNSVGSTVAPAGRGVTQSFDAVSGLFEELGQCTKRLNEVSHEEIPDALLPVYQLMLIGLMNVLALATKVTFRQMKDVKEGDHQMVINLKKKFRSAFQNVDEYIKQLLYGGNGEVQGAIGEIKKLVERESLVMQAVITRKTTRIEAVVKETDTKIELLIQQQRSFSIEIGQVVIDLKSSTAEMSKKVDKISDKIDAGLAETRRNNAVSKANQEEMMAGIKQILQLSSSKDGSTSNEPVAKAVMNRSNNKHDTLTSLRVRLDIKKTEKANAAALDMTSGPPELHDTSNWILQEPAVRDWLDGRTRLAIVSGEPGFGKTFLAGRAVRELLSKHKPGSQSNDRVVAYFFGRKAHPELGSVNAILRTLAFQLAASDKVYAKYLSELFENKTIGKGQSGLFMCETSTVSPDDGEEDVVQQELSEAEDSTPASQVKDQSTEPFEAAENGREQAPKLTGLPTSATPTDSVETATAQKATLQAVVDSIAGKHKLDFSYEQYLVENIAGLWKLLFCEYYKSSKTSACMLRDDGFDEDKSFAFENADASAILAAAEWAGRDKNAVWHGRVASALRDAGDYDESHIYYRQAIQMDEGTWHFHSGLAYKFLEQGDYSNAANSMKVAVAFVGIYAYCLEAEPLLRQVAFSSSQLTTINNLTADARTSSDGLRWTKFRTETTNRKGIKT
ncbi:uncharacterized protein MYCFIDRAFT_192695 [Pseudocercospora fijiensis CIRAD86]|uniref:Uncharacterized protein n=1 Tax=Pseudocercospora fijiensis (strain CIRAD86) TaxID=383855 RepID=N1Q7D2_PSEFD|nr:uncharacterized protein MYCFIDRAFT_192695 [Pseudocercospora fijiensis CIRAD86]EME88554.1 hypothetical protein MYCFIDRAFT_192695 [Pseudocercospora fijiensis CIRAD86]